MSTTKLKVWVACSLPSEAINFLEQHHDVVLAAACCKAVNRNLMHDDLIGICENCDAVALTEDFADHAPSAAAHKLAVALGLLIIIFPASWDRKLPVVR